MAWPDLDSPFYQEHARLLCLSYKNWTGGSLLPGMVRTEDFARALFDAPFVIVSHGTETDSIFNFGNRAALNLFEMSWEDFICLPSRKSADLDNREDRMQLMARVKADGYATDCKGVRVTASGRRFMITGATVWNVVDDRTQYHGQAAMFSNWTYL